jgi:heme/copper-type cytochrome/quinol oxidase subunit 2
VLAVTLFAASAVHAADASEQQQQSGAAAWFWGLFWMLLPIGIMVLVLVVFFRRTQKPHLERNKQHMQRQVQHMERMEQSMSRIIELLEKKD